MAGPVRPPPNITVTQWQNITHWNLLHKAIVWAIDLSFRLVQLDHSPPVPQVVLLGPDHDQLPHDRLDCGALVHVG